MDPELKLQRADYKRWSRKHDKRGEYILHFSCAKNYSALLEHALQEHAGGMSLPVRDVRGETALYIGAVEGHTQCVKLLLEQGHRRQREGIPAVVAAAIERNYVEILRLLLDSEVARESSLRIIALNNAESAIRVAFRLKQYESVQEMFDFWHDVVKDKDDSDSFVSPRYARDASDLLSDLLADPKAATVSKNIGLQLIDFGASFPEGEELARVVRDDNLQVIPTLLSIVAEDQRQDLMLSLLVAGIGNHSEQIVQLLLDHGASLVIEKAQDRVGNTILFQAVNERQASILRLLLDTNPDILSLNEAGESLLSIAAELDDTEIMENLKDNNPHIINITLTGEQPLLYKAIIKGEVGTVRWLLDAGAVVNVRDSEGNTALHHAASKGDLSILELLIDAGGSPSTVNKSHFFPIHVAARESNYEIFSRLFELDSTILTGEFLSGLFILAVSPTIGNVRILRDVMSLKPDVNMTMYGATALFWSVNAGQIEQVRILLDGGADVYRRDAESGYSILGLAVRVGHSEIIQLVEDKIFEIEFQREIDTTRISEGGDGYLHAPGRVRLRKYDFRALVEAIEDSIIQREGDMAGFSKSKTRGPADLLTNLNDRFFLKELYPVGAAPSRGRGSYADEKVNLVLNRDSGSCVRYAPSRQDRSTNMGWSHEPISNEIDQILQLAPRIFALVTKPDASLDYLRHASLSNLRGLSDEELEIYNQFLYEVDPIDREDLLDRLNGNGRRRYKASYVARAAKSKI